MRPADWLTLLVTILAGILVPLLVMVASNSRRTGRLEQKIDDLARSEADQNTRLDRLIGALDGRLRWLEERVWGADPRYPRGPRGGRN